MQLKQHEATNFFRLNLTWVRFGFVPEAIARHFATLKYTNLHYELREMNAAPKELFWPQRQQPMEYLINLSCYLGVALAKRRPQVAKHTA